MVHRSIMIAVLCIAACGGKQVPPPTVENVAPPDPVAAPALPLKSDIEVAMAKMEEFVSGMCACSDNHCADAVQERMTQWSHEMVTTRPAKRRDDSKPTEAEMKRLTDIGTRYAECMTKAMTPPSTP